MAIRLDGPRAWETRLTINWKVTDPDEIHLIEVENGVLNHRAEIVTPWETWRVCQPEVDELAVDLSR